MVSNIQHLFCLSILLSLFKSWARAEILTMDMEPQKTHKGIMDVNDYIMDEERRLAALNNHLLVAADCFELCKVFYNKKDFKNSLAWSMETLFKYKEETTEEHSFTEVEVLEYIAFTHYLLGDINTALEWTKKLLKLDPNHPRAAENVPHYERAIAQEAEASKKRGGTGDKTENKKANSYKMYLESDVAKSDLMTAADCFELCKIFYNRRDFKKSLAWSMETLRKYKGETTEKHWFTEAEVLEYIAFTHYLLGDVKTALEWTKNLLKLDPNHPRAAGNVPQYEEAIAEQEAASKKRGETGVETEDEKAEPDKLSEDQHKFAKEKAKYEALCRGEMEINSDVAKRLFCRYMSENHPFLRLAPIKAEQVYIDPDVFVFHGVLSDDEIQFIKVLSTPRLTRATVHNSTTGTFTAAYYRISKSAWLRDEESQVVARVSQRVADMTGLTTTSAEQLQVVNYGIGGHYEPHYDFATKNKFPFAQQDGNRIATVLFYMSNVLEGGATVFTELGLSVFPARGAALYWRNLHPSGEGDTATRHAACPVLRGSKWVCNKWLHEGGQELIKPCNWDYQREDMVRKIPRAVPKTSR